jgi:hypothetical protein
VKMTSEWVDHNLVFLLDLFFTSSKIIYFDHIAVFIFRGVVKLLRLRNHYSSLLIQQLCDLDCVI